MTTLIQEQQVQEFNSYTPVRTVIILLSGKAGTGKTLSANLLCEILDSMGSFDYAKMSIAKGVKDSAKNSFGWDGLKGEKGRRLLQDVGKTGRRYDRNIWIRMLADLVYSYPVLHDFILIDDWRFPNELKYLARIEDFDTYTIRLEAPDREILKGTPAYNDSSETSLYPCLDETALSSGGGFYDFAIDNSKEKENLKAQLTNILLTILKETSNSRVW